MGAEGEGSGRGLASLADALRAQRAVAWVGAGASAGLYPLWTELVQLLVASARDAQRATEKELAAWTTLATTQPQEIAAQIRKHLGEERYRTRLYEIFRTPPTDQRPFTDLQAILMSLPFSGYVTTNYDGGLIEARTSLRTATEQGWTTWPDEEGMSRWTREQLDCTQKSVLYLHGHYQRTGTVVLDSQSYQEAYENALVKRLLTAIFERYTVCFVGFSLSDSWFRSFLRQVLAPYKGLPNRYRHVLTLGDDGASDEVAGWEQILDDEYSIDALRYPVTRGPDGREDHSSIGVILRSLRATDVPGVAPEPQWTSPRPAPADPATAPSADRIARKAEIRFVHATTDDEFFVERPELDAKLNRWASDEDVTVVAVTGLGGTGKTSLIGHWLKHHGAANSRFQGAFFWSFYSNRAVNALFESLSSYLSELGAPETKAISDFGRVIDGLFRIPLLLVLDGLEVLQERPDHRQFGQLQSPELGSLVAIACNDRSTKVLRHRTVSTKSLLMMTSRFPFADVEPYIGSFGRAMRLESLHAQRVDRAPPSVGRATVARRAGGCRRDVPRASARVARPRVDAHDRRRSRVRRRPRRHRQVVTGDLGSPRSVGPSADVLLRHARPRAARGAARDLALQATGAVGADAIAR